MLGKRPIKKDKKREYPEKKSRDANSRTDNFFFLRYREKLQFVFGVFSGAVISKIQNRQFQTVPSQK